MPQDEMKMFLVLSVILGIHEAAAATHTLMYFYTASSGIPGFPEFISLGMLDGQQFDYYDSNIKRVIPKQDWMANNVDPEYWQRETQTSSGTEQTFKANIEIAKQRFSQTEGVHIFQWMYSCEWDDETGEVNGFNQFGYDGEDFIIFDLKTKSWIALKQQAFITKHRWERDRAQTEYNYNYFTQQCPEWLKKYVNYGRSSLLRTELPSVSIIQKPSSSMIRCHATGFYPNRAETFWRKDGEEIHEGVERGEILPNDDGTFQMIVDLKFSSGTPEDWTKYECVFQLSGVKEDLITRLKKEDLITRPEKPVDVSTGILTGLLSKALCFWSSWF